MVGLFQSMDDCSQISLNMRPDLFGFGTLKVFANSHCSVKVEHRFSLRRKDFQTVQYRFRLVIFTLNQIFTSLVIFSRYLRWAKQGIVNSA